MDAPIHIVPLLDVSRASLLSVRQPRGTHLAVRLMLLALLLFAAALALVPWQQSVPGQGRVIAYAPLDRQHSIEAPIDGRLQTWHVEEGTHVNEGDPIADVSDNDPEILARLERERLAIEARRFAAQSSVDVSKARITALELSRTAQSSSAGLRARMGRDRQIAAQRAVDAAVSAAETARLNLARMQALFDEGLASKRDLELARLDQATCAADLDSAKASLKASVREIGALDADADAVDTTAKASIEEARSNLASAESNLAAASADLVQLEVRMARQQRMKIVAPRDGTILKLIGRHGTDMVAAGDVIATFVPDMGASAVELYMSGKDGPLISAGRRVRLQFEGWPAVQFVGWPSVAVGTFGGVVEFVDALADESGNFRVVVSPDPDDLPWPDNRWLRQGVRANGWVLLERVQLGFELWRQINGFPPAPGPSTGGSS
ncbi:HlyD family efflux transporter periplasmic adaptor subunit [Nannocystis sp. ILAH1]|uniref:HlyD family secretion protein n=1 Tax=unclassified Nannocystis TaxID=2627009 RepID=UPI00226DA42F|nr:MULTISPECIES: HlyD family secretion protein [unclassified Nannocystis]MCY0992161.1 HlyD family efflux transporter periplasmic adaptor subunit [Nannocystis sp. ILAH1]MCY1064381.1 HlyD family efflux transporter periplasmic adaptor subunit [Nannocystis sp. RBIL2]